MLDPRADLARGYLMVGIVYMHMLFFYANTRASPTDAIATLIQIKLMAAHVACFFLLSGMGARQLKRRSLPSLLTHSLMLIALAAAVHGIAYWTGDFFHNPFYRWVSTLRQFAKPLLTGTGQSGFVGWFFIVLAWTRVITWTIERGWRWFVPAIPAYALFIWAGVRISGVDNFMEWRNVPAAVLFFLIGMRIPRDWAVPHWLGVIGLPLSLAIGWFNRPGLFAQGPCLSCDLGFATRMYYGLYGEPVMLIAMELSLLMFVLWLAQITLAMRQARLFSFLGQNSPQLLFLHGIVLAAIQPWLLPLLPPRESAVLLIGVLIGSVLFHAALLRLTLPILNAVMAACFTAARWLIDSATAVTARTSPR
ncbi:acyltransferase family protein [Sphingomonas sp. FW199]|uniref:acyltransferase family protein n=1 Tax=Sphingomonas sp. FW199 TaxID=3400217 RepID=UPI003CE7F6ED